MQAGDVVLIELLQSDGNSKFSPALVLKKLPNFNDFLPLWYCSRAVAGCFHLQLKNSQPKRGNRKSSPQVMGQEHKIINPLLIKLSRRIFVFFRVLAKVPMRLCRVVVRIV